MTAANVQGIVAVMTILKRNRATSRDWRSTTGSQLTSRERNLRRKLSTKAKRSACSGIGKITSTSQCACSSIKTIVVAPFTKVDRRSVEIIPTETPAAITASSSLNESIKATTPSSPRLNPCGVYPMSEPCGRTVRAHKITI